MVFVVVFMAVVAVVVMVVVVAVASTWYINTGKATAACCHSVYHAAFGPKMASPAGVRPAAPPARGMRAGAF